MAVWRPPRGGSYLLAAPSDAGAAAGPAAKGLLQEGHVPEAPGGGGGRGAGGVAAGSEGLPRRLPVGGAVNVAGALVTHVVGTTAVHTSVYSTRVLYFIQQHLVLVLVLVLSCLVYSTAVLGSAPCVKKMSEVASVFLDKKVHFLPSHGSSCLRVLAGVDSPSRFTKSAPPFHFVETHTYIY